MFVSMLPAYGPTAGHIATLEERMAPAASTGGTFALVSTFAKGTTYGSYGWNLLSGSAKLTDKPSYYGENVLTVKSGSLLSDSKGVVQGDQLISFQVAIFAGKGMAMFGVEGASGNQVAAVGVSGTTVYAGQSFGALEPVPTPIPQSVYPSGWVYITANVLNTSSQKSFSWTMQLFVDGSSSYFMNLSTPKAYSYTGIEIAVAGSSHAASYFTDIVLTSYEIPINIPGYNPMEGYGQGSGLLVNILPAFTVLRANMVLNSWNVPETGVLSFQINAMNYYGTTRSSCVGFFQLGVDINPNGYISPWYVPGVNCIAHYFMNSNNPSIQPGFPTPAGSVLTLSIIDQPSSNSLFFQIIDQNAPAQYKYWNATIPYNGTAFYSTYTQLEFQPFSSYPISNYYLNGSLYNLEYGSTSSLVPLNASYMIPFILNAPPTWSFAYYSDSTAGYAQTG
jgi:hypothetical protein